MDYSNNKSKPRRIAFILNIIIFIFEIFGIILCLNDGGVYNFVYFTVLSNVFAMIVSLIYVITYKRSESDELPRWLILIRYMATNCLSLTFFIVITVLMPMNYSNGTYLELLFRGPQPFHHVACPILSFISFCFYEKGELFKNDIWMAVIPSFIYACITTVLNVIKVFEGPYPFLEVYKQPVYMSVMWFIGIIGISYGLAWVIKYFSYSKKSNNYNEYMV